MLFRSLDLASGCPSKFFHAVHVELLGVERHGILLQAAGLLFGGALLACIQLCVVHGVRKFRSTGQWITLVLWIGCLDARMCSAIAITYHGRSRHVFAFVTGSRGAAVVVR